MALRRYRNTLTTFLAARALSTDTTITVTTSDGYPTDGDFSIKIDREIMLVTNITGTVWTVSRAQEGTSANGHALQATVFMPLTEDDLLSLSVQSVNGTVGSVRRQIDFVDGGGVSWVITDDPTNETCHIQATATGGGGIGSVWREGTSVPSDALGVDNDLYLRTSTGDVYFKSSGTYSLSLNILGATGATGTIWHTGTGVPSSGLGADDDYYINRTTADIYLKVSGSWVLQFTLAANGTGSGTIWRNGAGVPSNGLGSDGDYYLNDTAGTIYYKASGSYSLVATIHGAAGTTWLTASGIPSSGTGANGDLSFDITTGAVYLKTTGAWALYGNLRTVWRNGTGVPSNTLGNNGDYYIDNDLGDVYYKATGTYSLITNIRGSQWRLGVGAPSNGLGANGDLYINTSSGEVYAKATGTYSLQFTISGGGAVTGSIWRNGSTVPSNGLGIDNDYYLRTSTGDVYFKSSSAYTLIANLHGADGAAFRSGNGTPSNSLGVNNDYYLDNLTGIVYQRSSGTYGSIATLKSTWRSGSGAPTSGLGAVGDFYLDNDSGIVYYKDVSATYSVTATLKITWRNGTGVPSNGLGNNGDYYINNTTGNLYFKTANVYTLLFTMSGGSGTSGAAGSVWRDGNGAPSNALGINGDYYLDRVADNVYSKAGGVYSIAANIKGSTGISGSVWRNGSGTPSDTLGVQGDYYFQTVVGVVWFKNSGTYQVITTLKGADGTNGTPGSQWRNGTSVPDNSIGINGDYYLNTSNGNVYQRGSGIYSLIYNVKGATGATGATGAAGTNGSSLSGSTWRTGSGVPSDGDGSIDGDFFLSFTGGIYRKLSGHYTYQFISLMGATGATGATGPQGPVGPSGTAGGTTWRITNPDNTVGQDGDFYIYKDLVTRKASGIYKFYGWLSGGTGHRFQAYSQFGPGGSVSGFILGDLWLAWNDQSVYFCTGSAWQLLGYISAYDPSHIYAHIAQFGPSSGSGFVLNDLWLAYSDQSVYVHNGATFVFGGYVKSTQNTVMMGGLQYLPADVPINTFFLHAGRSGSLCFKSLTGQAYEINKTLVS